jgi:excisionase family DNA binding protein
VRDNRARTDEGGSMDRPRPTDENQQSVEIAQRLLRPHEVAAFLGVPLQTIYRWRYRHEGPLGYRVGRHVRYRAADVEQWLEERRDTSQAR